MRIENLKASCRMIEQANERTGRVIRKFKNLPPELFMAVNLSYLLIKEENKRIRRAIWRTKK